MHFIGFHINQKIVILVYCYVDLFFLFNKKKRTFSPLVQKIYCRYIAFYWFSYKKFFKDTL